MKIRDLAESSGSPNGLEAIVTERIVREKKNGDQFFNGKLMDDTGSIPFTVWDISLLDTFTVGNAVIINDGSTGEYKGEPQLTIKYANVIPPERAEAAGIIPASPLSRKDLDTVFETTLSLIRKFIDNFDEGLNRMVKDGTLEKFKLYPAAKGIHQAYLRGLYEHSVSVTRLAYRCVGVYENREGYGRIDTGVLLLGALFHDIGKIFEYERGPLGLVSDISVEGGLCGHHFLGAEYLKKIFGDVLPEERLAKLTHIVLAHHGRKEWGSPVEPRIMEAVIVHHCDMMDACFERYTENPGTDRWLWNMGNDQILNI